MFQILGCDFNMYYPYINHMKQDTIIFLSDEETEAQRGLAIKCPDWELEHRQPGLVLTTKHHCLPGENFPPSSVRQV